MKEYSCTIFFSFGLNLFKLILCTRYPLFDPCGNGHSQSKIINLHTYRYVARETFLSWQYGGPAKILPTPNVGSQTSNVIEIRGVDLKLKYASAQALLSYYTLI